VSKTTDRKPLPSKIRFYVLAMLSHLGPMTIEELRKRYREDSGSTIDATGMREVVEGMFRSDLVTMGLRMRRGEEVGSPPVHVTKGGREALAEARAYYASLARYVPGGDS